MIVCPNCNHQNPDGAVQCEACYTPLPEMTTCATCGAEVQADASFCGQCGTNLQAAPAMPPDVSPPDGSSEVAAIANPDLNLPDLLPPDPLIQPDPIGAPELEPELTPPPPAIAPVESPVAAPPEEPVAASSGPTPGATSTQLQQLTARLLHIQTNTVIELAPSLTLLHMGKPNDRIPPDIDVSGFPDSEIVSRLHADIRVEGDLYYIEDVGSSNGTYVNNLPLPIGNRHRLRPGDRIALGKGDKVSFIFQQS